MTPGCRPAERVRRERHSGLRRGGVVAGLLAAAALAGCGSVTGPVHYPAGWAPLAAATTADGCPPVAGRYANQGSGAFPPETGEAPALSEVFARMGRGPRRLNSKGVGPAWPEAPGATAVSIRQDPESLVVSFVDAAQPTTPLAFRRYHFDWSETRYDDLFTCYIGDGTSRLRFLAEPEGHAGVFANLYMEAGGTLVMLLKASDGSLVVQWRSESVAISSLLIGSHVRFDSVWWRYPPLPDPP
jgi:hypothetical protein